MCVEVEVIKDGACVFCSTVGELAAALGKATDEISPDGSDFCLCNARLEELGARRVVEGEGDPWWGYLIEVPA